MIPSSLRVHLIWLILLTVIPLAGLTIFNTAEQYQQNRATAEQEARNVAQLVSLQQDQYIEATQQLLLALAQLSEVREQESATCSQLFANLHEQYPLYTGIGAHYPDGESFCLSLPGDPVSFGERPWFQRAVETRTFAFGEYDIGPASGLPLLVVSYPLLDTSGEVESVLVAGLSLAWINERLASLETRPGTMLSVIDRNGTILSHYPNPELVGTQMTNTELLTTILEQESDVVEVTDEDGVTQLVTFLPLSSDIAGASMVVSTPTQIVFADITTTLARNLLLLMAMICLVLIVGWWWSNRFIVGPINMLMDTTHRLTQGDLSARTRMHVRQGELGALATAIDQMAESLETRIISEQQAQAETQRMHQVEMENLERLEHAITEYLAFVDHVAQGDLTRRLTVTHNSTGDQESAMALQRLSVGMNSMVENLHRLTTQVQQASTRIASASAEILAATAQQAAGATEQSAAMSQTTTTVEQIKAIAHQTTQQASTMAHESQQALDMARQGTQVVEETIGGMTTIRKHMDSIAQTILALSDQTQAIGSIITTVGEIADQSNMLALNAAIEAARAGEQGRSFAVVAQQVRDLAERSKAATAQVQEILGEIQRCTNTAVMVTEEGNRGVEAGAKHASDAGSVIHRIAAEVENGAHANAIIASAAQQQTAGVEQLGQAMRSIEQATHQTLASTRQTEQAARDLHSLAQSLQSAIAVYRL